MGTSIHPSQTARVARELEQAMTVDGEFFKVWPVWDDCRKRERSPDVGPRGRTKRSETYLRELDEQQKMRKEDLMREWKSKEARGIQGSRGEERKSKVPLGGGGYESVIENKALEGTSMFGFLPSLRGAECSGRVQRRLGLSKNNGGGDEQGMRCGSKGKAEEDNYRGADARPRKAGLENESVEDDAKSRGKPSAKVDLKAPIQPGKARSKRLQD